MTWAAKHKRFREAFREATTYGRVRCELCYIDKGGMGKALD
jgi:hypothetical protein